MTHCLTGGRARLIHRRRAPPTRHLSAGGLKTAYGVIQTWMVCISQGTWSIHRALGGSNCLNYPNNLPFGPFHGAEACPSPGSLSKRLVRDDKRNRQTINDFGGLYLRTSSGHQIPLKSVRFSNRAASPTAVHIDGLKHVVGGVFLALFLAHTPLSPPSASLE